MADKNSEFMRLRDAGPAWKQWGPYLSERQWGTVREDYSAHGNAWDYFPHDHARSREYRWGEAGIAGLCAAAQRLPPTNLSANARSLGRALPRSTRAGRFLLYASRDRRRSVP